MSLPKLHEGTRGSMERRRDSISSAFSGHSISGTKTPGLLWWDSPALSQSMLSIWTSWNKAAYVNDFKNLHIALNKTKTLPLLLNCQIFFISLWLSDGVLQHPKFPQLVWWKAMLCPDGMIIPASRKLGQISLESWEEGIMGTEEMKTIWDVKKSIFLQAV